MITKLDNSNEDISKQIYYIFQNAYKVEAKLIGTLHFPPLSRTAKNVLSSKSIFYGFRECDKLAGVIEIVFKDNQLDIHSLTVEPRYFNKGIAGKLIAFVLEKYDCSKAIVETAVVNTPAINLYMKYGFVEYKRWIPSHGIEKLALSIEYGSANH